MFALETPAAFRLREVASALPFFHRSVLLNTTTTTTTAAADSSQILMAATAVNSTLAAMVANDHSSHPNFLRLAGLVCEAVLEVVFVALPGFLVAWNGMFDANSQKFVAELNTMVFTPCLIFTKLASQLNADKLSELAVIPVIFIVQTIVSWTGAQIMARLFGFGKMKRQKNFILAMGVFGNSNSLPISLVLSLSQTISGLHWDKIPGDNDDEVGARGILYLLIFQQLGQLLRWTWGYSVLLKPKEAYEEEERAAEEAAATADGHDRLTEEGRYRDEPDGLVFAEDTYKPVDSGVASEVHTPRSSGSSEHNQPLLIDTNPTPANGNNISTDPTMLAEHVDRMDSPRSVDNMTRFPKFTQSANNSVFSLSPTTWKTRVTKVKNTTVNRFSRLQTKVATALLKAFRTLPTSLQKFLSTLHYYHMCFWKGVWRQMNPPLWAMLAALIVASVPALQQVFFTRGTLVNNSVTHAIQQSGGVAVPLILVVLGANLARSTLPADQLATTAEDKAEERKLLIAAILARMIIPTIVMAPLLALAAKYAPVSILDDPIFIIVCFLLTGAPSALQLAQICQLNNVFMGAMSNLLVWSYVVAIFPSTLLLVLMALETLEWALRG